MNYGRNKKMELNGHEVEVVIEYKRIKNIYFRINEELQIYVTCSKRVSKKSIEELLEKNRASLEKMYKKALKRNEKKGKVLYLGEELDFVFYKRIMFEEKMAFGPSVEDINAYLEKHALPYFQSRLDLYRDSFSSLPKFRLRIRKMKSRWGVCNQGSMTVTLNSLLIHKKPYLIDYVIVHELSHFSHMDHSKQFWECVERHFPRYKEARKELRE